MKPILVPYDENMTKEELLKAIADAAGSDVETVKKELCEPKTEPQTDGYMNEEQTEDYRKMLDKAEHNIYGNIEDEPQTSGKPYKIEVSSVCKTEPQIEYCPRCGMRILVDKPKTEPQTEETQDGFYDEYYRDHEEFYEPRTVPLYPMTEGEE